MANYVSEAVIRRLPGYYRHLKELEAEGILQISSQELGERMKLTASQIRQDINCFGGFGRQGYGYAVEDLRAHIAHILGVDEVHTMIIIGAGNIGRAIALSDAFSASGFHTVAIFDDDPQKIGMHVGELVVSDIHEVSKYISSSSVDICALAVPVEKAQMLAEEISSYGVKGFWNFAPTDLKLPLGHTVVNVHLEEGLQILSFRMLQTKGQ